MRAREFIVEGEVDLIDALRDFLPIAIKTLKLKSLPQIKFEKNVESKHDQPTFGKYENEQEIICLDIEERHPIDIIRTLAHELVHYQQDKEGRLNDKSWKTGSPDENEAHEKAGIMMREFDKKFSKYLKLHAVQFNENFADGKNPGRKGLAKRSGVNTKASVSSLRKTAKHSTGEKARMAHWLANMKAGRAKHKESMNEFAPGNGDSGEEDTLQKYARIWYKSDNSTQQKIEMILSRMGWEIGEIESEEGGVFVVQAGDEHGNSYIGFAPDDLTEGWKDWVAGAAIGAAALGGHGDAEASRTKHNIQKPAVVKQIKADPATDKKIAAITKSVNTPSDIATNNLSKNTHEEHILQKVAIQSGIKGVELAQFMAQCAHESADFAHMKEIGGKKDFKKYDPKFAPGKAKILGNKHVGDGERYKGRGFIQITGRDNYRMAGNAIGLPLEQKPEIASKPEVAAKIAVWYWNTRVKPHVSNFNDTAAVTKKINPALRGLEDRHANFKQYKNILL